MNGWRGDASGRRRTWFALALLAHTVLVATMLHLRVSHDEAVVGRTVQATILLSPAPRPEAAVTPLPLPRPARLRSIPHPAAEPRSIQAPPLEAQPITQAAKAPEPPASAASQPLNLTLTRDQLRAVIAGNKPTLAQSLARGPAPSALSQIGGDDTYSEKALPGGVTEVHIHGSCFRLVPTPAAKADPFNHGGALPGPCLGSF